MPADQSSPSSAINAALNSSGLCVLDPGSYALAAPILMTRPGSRLSGTIAQGNRATVVRRGRNPDGSIYRGPLIQASDADTLSIADLIIDGTVAAESAGAPYASFQPDISLARARHCLVRNVELRRAQNIAIAVGHGCEDIRLAELDVIEAGHMGVWLGIGVDIGGDLPLPLPQSAAALRPRRLAVDRCRFENCAGPALYVEAEDLEVSRCRFRGNHGGFPHNCDGGQIIIDYKAASVTVSESEILDGPWRLRRVPQGAGAAEQELLLRVVGIEASGQGLRFDSIVVSGNSHEGLHFNGASDVLVTGRTRLVQNHTARNAIASLATEPDQNLSITTTQRYAGLNAFARNITVDGIRCENGIIVWSNGSVPDLRVDGLKVAPAFFQDETARLVVTTNPDGTSLRGASWDVPEGR